MDELISGDHLRAGLRAFSQTADGAGAPDLVTAYAEVADHLDWWTDYAVTDELSGGFAIHRFTPVRHALSDGAGPAPTVVLTISSVGCTVTAVPNSPAELEDEAWPFPE